MYESKEYSWLTIVMPISLSLSLNFTTHTHTTTTTSLTHSTNSPHFKDLPPLPHSRQLFFAPFSSSSSICVVVEAVTNVISLS